MRSMTYRTVLSMAVVMTAVFALASCVSGITPLKIAPSGQHIPERVDFLYYDDSVKVTFKQQSANIYKYEGKRLTENDAVRLFQNAGGVALEGDLLVVSEQDRISIEGDGEYFFLERDTGRFCYSKRDKVYSPYIDGNPANGVKVLIGEERARELAESFLLANDLLPSDFHFSKASTNYVETEGITIPTNITVFFNRRVEERNVYGVSRIVVTVGHQGEIEEVLKLHNDIVPFRTVNLRPITDAFEDVKQRRASITFDGPIGNAHVTRVELAYYEDSVPLEEQPYMQPIYVFWGVVEDHEQLGEVWNAIVPAIDYHKH